MDRGSVLYAYALPVGLAGLVGSFSAYLGDPPATIFHKMLVTPLYLLAMRGLRQFFPEHRDATRDFATHVEFLILQSALISSFITLALIPQISSGLWPSVATFLLTGILGGGINIGLYWLDRRKTQ